MRLDIRIDGKIEDMMASEVRSGERAVTLAMKQAGASLKSIWRGQVASAGLGSRLANAVRNKTFPTSGSSLRAAALVYTKAPKIMDAHERGALIRSSSGFWLAIPTPSAGRGRRGRITPGEWENRTGRRLRFVYRSGRSALLVDDGTLRQGHAPAFGAPKKRGFKNRTVPIFILVPQVKLKKRLDLFKAANAVHALLPSRIVKNWQGE
ncbi:DUF6441 family protein [Defluviimonas sp. WL0002]|uniref:DUF6441 family protein n=1 Tax=Albidovulum marisflavi TaxID=2984159 RepID=A0ABT2ZHM6_9RHOB|nr:DUF6441 family protein [Defluviimonas sp. WL0002]MCV2870638.1 DUF6441 family protein [Defluviimonas sp. WL0002]